MVDVLYVLPNVPEPRNVNIVNLIKDEKKVQVLYWQKNNGEIKNNLDNKVIVTPISVEANDYNPFARIIPTVKYFNKAYKTIKEVEPKCIHVSKLDSMYLVYKYWKRAERKPYVIYDISDMHRLTYNDSNNPLMKMIRAILHQVEQKVSKCVDKIVVTSMAFWTEYYKEFYSEEQIVFVPNAPDLSVFDGFKRKTDGKYAVGFIGSVRYYKQLKCLIDAAQEADVNVLIAGGGIDEERLRQYTASMDNVQMTGRFEYAKEASHLYGMVDCVFAQYDTSIRNVALALPNRLYEAAYCGLPLIVSKGTYLEILVKKYGLGISVKDLSKKNLVEALRWLKKQADESFVLNGQKFSADNDYSVLSGELKKIYLDNLGDIV